MEGFIYHAEESFFGTEKMRFLLTFDMEEYYKDSTVERSISGSERMQDFLKKNNIKSTMFFTGFFAENSGDLIKRCLKQGHEIALHGYRNDDDYRRKENVRKISHAKEIIEEKTGKEIKGFRSPRMKKLGPLMLRKLGFLYDSSSHPTIYPGNFGILQKRGITRSPIIQIPVSVTPFLRFPFSWFWFKNLGLTYSKFCTKMCMKDDYVMIYFHPWEFAGKGGRAHLEKLQRYVDWCKSQGFDFSTIIDFLEGHE